MGGLGHVRRCVTALNLKRCVATSQTRKVYRYGELRSESGRGTAVTWRGGLNFAKAVDKLVSFFGLRREERNGESVLSNWMGYVQEARENHVKKKVEEALRSKMKAKALKECDHYTSKYAECAYGRTISVVWKCREQAKVLNDCLHQFTNDEVLEKMKREYMLQEDKGLKLQKS